MIDPSAAAALNLLNTIRIRAQDVKVYKRRCRNLSLRCNGLISALDEDNVDLDGTTIRNARSEAQAILLRVRGKVDEWANINRVKSILGQSAISEGIDGFERDIDACLASYQITVGRELVQVQRQQSLLALRDHAELRDMIQDLNHSLARNNRASQISQSDQAAVEIIQNVEEDIRASGSTTPREDAFEEAMRRFCESLTDVTAQLENHVHNPAPATIEPIVPDFTASRVSITSSGSSSLNFAQPSRRPSAETPRNSIQRHRLRALESLGRLRSITSFRSQPSPSESCPRISLPLLDEEDEADLFFRRGGFPTPTPSIRNPSMHSRRSSVRDPPIMSRRSSVVSARPTVPNGSPSLRGSFFPNTPGSPGQYSTASLYNGTGSWTSLDVALFSPDSIYKVRSGKVEAGTLEGLVECLLRSPADSNNDEAFFISHTAFTSSQHLLEILIHRFHDATPSPGDERATIRRNVLGILKYWLNSPHVVIPNDVLVNINDFAASVDSSEVMRELAFQVMQLISERRSLNLPFSPVIPSYHVTFDLKQTTSDALAVILTIIEAEKYRNIIAAECVAHVYPPTAGRRRPKNLEEALELNKKIRNWVKLSLLQIDHHEERARTKTLFVNTAKKCQRIRNFSSMFAIVDALNSPVISCLSVTHGFLTPREQNRLERLSTLFKTEADYSAYRAALRRDDDKFCVPWLDVHLHDIDTVGHTQDDVIEYHGHCLLNFGKWINIKNKTMDALRYRDLPTDFHEGDYEEGVLLLSSQLRGITLGHVFDEDLEMKSHNLREREGILTESLPLELRAVGF